MERKGGIIMYKKDCIYFIDEGSKFIPDNQRRDGRSRVPDIEIPQYICEKYGYKVEEPFECKNCKYYCSK
jgi:hypothetical protein